MAAARKRFDTPSFPFKYAETIIQRDEAAARKDNDFIYHARIPDVKSLAPIGRASLAKQLPPTFPLMGDRFVGKKENALSLFHISFDRSIDWLIFSSCK